MPDRPGGRDGLLTPYRALDLTDESGFLCGKILGDLGADVIKVERPGGDPSRRLGPFPSNRPDPEQSLYWQAHNHNKRGITLSLRHSRGRELFQSLVRRADFLIETFTPGWLERLGLGFAALRAINPGLIHVSITPFGQRGVYRHFKGSDIVAMATSGMMSLVGELGRPPLRVSLPQSPLWAGMYAAAGALIALFHRGASGCGQQVDISLQSGLLWALANAPSFWSTNRTFPRRQGRRITGRSVTGATMRAIFRCSDGYINFIVYGGAAGRRSNEALVKWMAEEGMPVQDLLEKDWSRFDIHTTTQQEIDEIEEPAAELILRCSKSEFLKQAHQRGILGYPVADAQDILGDDQLEAREFWQTMSCPTGNGNLRFPGPFARFSETPLELRRPAPRIGQHNEEFYAEELHLTRRELSALQRDRII